MTESLAKILECFQKDTAMHSSMVSVSHKPSVQMLIAAGLPMVEYVFHVDNKVTLSFHLMEALVQITGQNPVQEENRGHIHAMREDWYVWATEHNYR